MFGFFCFCDASHIFQLGIQDPATPLAVGIYKFHHDLIFIFILVVIFVTWILFRIVFLFHKSSSHIPSVVVHGTTVEVIWTIIPALMLMLIAVPSFSLLYAVDEVIMPSITLKVISSQWYWTYEYSDYSLANQDSLIFSSYILPDSDLSLGNLRLLEVDNRVVIPVETHVRLIITSSDVLHSWTVPSFGVKIDACPGRLNEATFFVDRPGVFYGQCSELCGINHGFIPIVVEVLPLVDYVSWLSLKLKDCLYLLW